MIAIYNLRILSRELNKCRLSVKHFFYEFLKQLFTVSKNQINERFTEMITEIKIKGFTSLDKL